MSRCQSLTLCPEEWRFLKHRQTNIVKHTNSHISSRSRGAACVFEPKGLTNGISEGQQVNVQRPKDGSHAGDSVRLCLFVVSQ